MGQSSTIFILLLEASLYVGPTQGTECLSRDIEKAGIEHWHFIHYSQLLS